MDRFSKLKLSNPAFLAATQPSGGVDPTQPRFVTGGPVPGTYTYGGMSGGYPYYRGPNGPNNEILRGGDYWNLGYFNHDTENYDLIATATLTALPEQATWNNGITVTA